MVGSVAELAGFYRISVRVVAVETGLIVASDSIELDADLLENAAEKYQPPKYRLLIGSSMSWFPLTPNGLGTYSIGFQLGGSYQIARDQWLSLQTIYFFWHYGIHDDQVDEIGSTNADYRLVHTFAVLAGYGYRFPLSRAISFQPTVSAGAVLGGLNASETFTDSITYYTELFQPSSFWASPAVEARADLVFMERSPISFYLGTGYFLYTRMLQESYRTLWTEVLLNGIKLEGAIMFYF